MSRSAVIVNNAFASYLRLLVAAGSGFITIPVVLHKLGPIDYGIFSVIAGIVGMALFINGALTAGAQRHIAYALGAGKLEEVETWFSASLLIHCFVAGGVLLVGALSSQWVIQTLLSLPAAKLHASSLIYLMVIAALSVTILSTPYYAILMAHEALVVLSLISIASSLFLVAGVLALQFLPGDALLWYASIYVLSQFILFGGPIVYCIFRYRECRCFKLNFSSKSRVRELLAFAGWNLFGTLAVQIRYQGPAILFNRFIGTMANAANGIAMQVGAFASSVSTGLLRATSPAIVKSEASGERDRVLLATNLSNKYGFVLLWLMIGPILFELRYCLGVWLHEMPSGTVIFAMATLTAVLVDMLTAGFMASVQADGRIAVYQVVVGLLLCCSVPLGYLALRWHMPPSSVLWALVASSVLAGAGRVAFVSRVLGFSFVDWLLGVVVPCSVVVAACSAGAALVLILLQPGIARLGLLFFLNTLVTLPGVWLFAPETERSVIQAQLRSRIGSIRTRLQASSFRKPAFFDSNPFA
jgi:O-antigen/teichoic acid export membrane protein